MKYDIFISYRREGGYETAKHLYDLLTRDGYSVSFDIDTLRNGDFDITLLNRIDECTDFILVLDAHAFDRTLDISFPKENDWLYQELSYALKQNKNVIPIMLTGFSFPDDLPDDIVKVQRKNGPKYDQYYFDEFYKKLKKEFFDTPAPKVSTAISSMSNGPLTFMLKITVDETSMLYIDDKKVRKIKQGTTANINTLKYGYKYKITLINLAVNDEDYSIEYEVPDKRESDEIKVEFKTMREQRKNSEKEKKQKINQLKKQRIALTHTLRSICEEAYEWFDKICFDTVRVKRNGKFGFLNLQGFEFIRCAFVDATNFEGEYAYVYNGEKWGIINLSGFLVIDYICDQSSWISDGFSALVMNGKQKLVNLHSPNNQYGPYDDIIVTEHQNRFIVKDQMGYSLINENGSILSKNRFVEYDNYQSTTRLVQNERVLFPIIISCKETSFSYLSELNQDNVPIYKGLMDENGEMLIPCIMESISPIALDPYAYEKTQHYNSVNYLEFTEYLESLGYFIFFGVKVNSNYGIFDINTSRYSMPPIYKRIIEYRDIYSSFYVCNNMNKWGCVDIYNNEIIPFIYDDCRMIQISDYSTEIRYSLNHDDFNYGFQGNHYFFDTIGLFKLLSQEIVQIEDDQMFYFAPVENYKSCIIDCFNRYNSIEYPKPGFHYIINYPYSYRYSSFGFIFGRSEFEVLSINRNRIKDSYYEACCDLYGDLAANRLMNAFMECTDDSSKEQISILKEAYMHARRLDENYSNKILENAVGSKKEKVFYPDYSIICSGSSDYAYRVITEERNRINELLQQNGFSCQSSKVVIVLLTEELYDNEKTISQIQDAFNDSNPVILLGGSPIYKKQRIQLEQWITNHHYFDMYNIATQKERIIYKIYAILNSWDGAESDSVSIWGCIDEDS